MQWASVSDGLLREAGEQYRKNKQLSNDLLCCLNAVHGKTLMPALQLLDEAKVTIVKAECGRWVYRVSGSSGVPYICVPGSSYCQCPAFKYCVMLRKESLLCKHVLAAKLATHLAIATEKKVSDEELMNILAAME